MLQVMRKDSAIPGEKDFLSLSSADDGVPATVPTVEWADIQPGVPCSFVAWRGIGGTGGKLNGHWREWMGRDLLLGPGIYACPSRHTARKYGTATRCLITLDNPYVLRCPKRGKHGSYFGPVKDLDLPALRLSHDGIALAEAVTDRREDMRQSVIFTDQTHKVVFGWRKPKQAGSTPG